MGIGIASGDNRATEAAKKAISSPLLETSIDGAQGVLMNITGGSNLSLYEVQEAADIVASASDHDVNMIFGSVINENLKDEIVVTVIATGFNEEAAQPKPSRPSFGQQKQPAMGAGTGAVKREQPKREEPQQEPVRSTTSNNAEDTLDIPTFLRNRNRRR